MDSTIFYFLFAISFFTGWKKYTKGKTIYTKCVLCNAVYKYENNYYQHFIDTHGYIGDATSTSFKESINYELSGLMSKKANEEKRKYESEIKYFKIIYDLEYDQKIKIINDLTLFFPESEVRESIISCKELKTGLIKKSLSKKEAWKKEKYYKFFEVIYHKPSLLTYSTKVLKKNNNKNKIFKYSFGSMEIRHKNGTYKKTYSISNFKFFMYSKRIELNKEISRINKEKSIKKVKKEELGKDYSRIKKVKKEDKPIKSNNEELGFGWGKFWIVMGFLLGGLALVFSVIMGVQTPQLSNRGVGLLISIFGIGSAYGVMQRKLFGLYLVYATLVLGIVGGLVELKYGEEFFIIQGAIAIVISIFWFIYFNKRKEMFS